MRTILWLLYVILFLLLTIPVLLYMRVLQRRGEEQRVQQIVDTLVPFWAKSLCKLAGAKVSVSGLENLPEGGCLIVSNHQSYFDIPVLLSVLKHPFGFVAKSSVHYIPVIGSWMRHIHCVSINRDDPRGAMATLLDSCVKELGEGHAVCIFPEGTRSGGGEIKPFKKGAFVTAETAGVPIVPVVIEGSYNLWENSPMGIRPARVMVTFLPAVYPMQMEQKQRANLPIALRKTMIPQRMRMRVKIYEETVRPKRPGPDSQPAGGQDGNSQKRPEDSPCPKS